jgi:hypothetical protein
MAAQHATPKEMRREKKIIFFFVHYDAYMNSILSIPSVDDG